MVMAIVIGLGFLAAASAFMLWVLQGFIADAVYLDELDYQERGLDDDDVASR